MATKRAETDQAPGLSPYLLVLQEELRGGSMKRLADFALGDLAGEVALGRDSLWVLVRRPGLGGIALRTACCPGGPLDARKRDPHAGEVARIAVESPLGRHLVTLEAQEGALHRLRVRVTLTPSASVLVPFLPRDLYPLDEKDDPAAAIGCVEAAQRGVNSGLIYFHTDEPAFGTVLYFQNLTALNDYFRATHTKPDAAVGGEWPELGYLPPTPPQSGTPPTNPLPAGGELVLSDAILVFRDNTGKSEQDMARLFLQMLGAAYEALDRPDPGFHDWPGRAERTLKDLRSPKAIVRAYGHLYIHPYTASEYPDSMVQLSLVQAIHEYACWRGKPVPLEKQMLAGVGKFYDGKLHAIRRYLPNVGDDKNANAVDSWYLYHPLGSLAALAIEGDEGARALFLKSVDFGIEAAHHFNYRWPIQYDITDFSVITAARGSQGYGQTDVGGLYAYIMLQAYKLTDDDRFLHEARAAIEASMGARFNLEYQANLTAWGAAACMRLWRITDDERYQRQSYIYLASFFHNCEIWQSRIGCAVDYANFFGVTALHDSPYMSAYEYFDSFSAFGHFLSDGGPQLEPAARMLVSEFCKYALDNIWFYYPDALPEDILATDIRNGEIDRSLSFPLEDLYGDGQPPGQVGQEIYGAGAAFVLASRAFHDWDGVPFRLFCDQFLLARDRTGDKALTVALDGGETCTANLWLLKRGRGRVPETRVLSPAGEELAPCEKTRDGVHYRVPARGRLTLNWN